MGKTLCLSCVENEKQTNPLAEFQPIVVKDGGFPLICEKCNVNYVILADGTVVGGYKLS